MNLMFEDTPMACRGEFHIEVWRKGKPVSELHDHNLVVNVGRERLARLAAGLSRNHITQIGVGTGTTIEEETDTKLQEQQLFPLSGVSVDGRDAKFEFIIGENEANGLSITEFGLFCADDAMFSHRVRRDEDTGKIGVIDKMSDIELRGYWLLHF
ncbi:MAG: hypothetical protein IJ521_11100 [Schwartzia sp.]|nr:hypothetical protein [Schwartzia sp. (in: firmicutes)]